MGVEGDKKLKAGERKARFSLQFSRQDRNSVPLCSVLTVWYSCFNLGSKLFSETEIVFAKNLFNTGSLWELRFIIIIFHKAVTYRIMSPNKPTKK